jgi:hypothetical protein
MWLLRTIESASSIRGCEPRLGGESRAMAKHGGRTSRVSHGHYFFSLSKYQTSVLEAFSVELRRLASSLDGSPPPSAQRLHYPLGG